MPPVPLISHRLALRRLSQLIPEADARNLLANLRMTLVPKRGEHFRTSDIDEVCAALRARSD